MLSAGHSEYFEYDGLNRLERFERGTLSFSGSTPTGTTGTTRTLDWSLDTVGNWTSLSTNGTAVSRTHDLQNRLTGVGSSTLTYDDNGNQTTGAYDTGFTHDAWNQLVTVEGLNGEGGWVGVNGYVYDALGRRFLKLDGEDAFYAYVYSAFGTGGGQLLVDWVVGEGVQYLTWGIAYENGLVSRDTIDDAGDVLDRVYVHTEANWNTSSTLRGEANLSTGTPSWSSVERYAMDPYGANVMVMDSAFGVKSGGSDYGWHVHFQGGFTDLSTGLIRFGAREYDPVQGRWKQQDPLGWPDGANVYEFVRGNPLTGVDPSGMFWWVVGAVVGAATDVTLQLITNGGNVDNIDWVSVGVSAGTGALGVGLGSKIAQIPSALGRAGGNAVLGGGLGAGGQVAENAIKGNELTEGVGGAALGGAAGGAAGGAIAEGVESGVQHIQRSLRANRGGRVSPGTSLLGESFADSNPLFRESIFRKLRYQSTAAGIVSGEAAGQLIGDWLVE